MGDDGQPGRAPRRCGDSIAQSLSHVAADQRRAGHIPGVDAYEAEGNPFPEATLESIKRTKVGIKGPTTTPVGSGFRSVNVLLRKELDLYACLRPCKAYEGVRTRFPETDVVIVRENHEDLYAGVEYEQGKPETLKLRDFIEETEGTHLRDDIGVTVKAISIFGTQRIVREAFEYAK